MTKFRCCRLHNLFVFFLALCAFSLVNHYLADAATYMTGAAPCQVQQAPESCTANPGAVQGANLHGGFMLNEVHDFSILPALWVRVETTEPYALTWGPPALVRPPIL